MVLHTIDRLEAGGPGSLKDPLLKVADLMRRRSMVAIISDFYEQPEDVVSAVSPLHHKGCDLILFHLLDAAEIDFPFDQAAQFQDMETDQAVPVVPDVFRDQYRELIQAHTRDLAAKLQELHIDYQLINTSEPLDAALYSYLLAPVNGR